MNDVIILMLLSLCFILVPVIAASIGGWAAYWGIFVLSVIWCLLLLLFRLRHWEE